MHGFLEPDAPIPLPLGAFLTWKLLTPSQKSMFVSTCSMLFQRDYKLVYIYIYICVVYVDFKVFYVYFNVIIVYFNVIIMYIHVI